jgi:hypothetical protein
VQRYGAVLQHALEARNHVAREEQDGGEGHGQHRQRVDGGRDGLCLAAQGLPPRFGDGFEHGSQIAGRFSRPHDVPVSFIEHVRVQLHGFVEKAAGPHFAGQRRQDISQGGALFPLGQHFQPIDQVYAGPEQQRQLMRKSDQLLRPRAGGFF